MPAEAIYQNAVSQGFRWLQKQRKDYPACYSVWQLSKDRPTARKLFGRELLWNEGIDSF